MGLGIIGSALSGGAGALLKHVEDTEKDERELRQLDRKGIIQGQIAIQQNGLDTQKALTVQQAKLAWEQARQNSWLAGGGGPAAGGGGGQAGAAGGGAGSGGMPGADAAPTGVEVLSNQQGQAQAVDIPGIGSITPQNLPALAKKFGIPEESIRLKMADGDLKGVGEMIFQVTKRDIDTSGGVAIDKSRLRHGEVLPRISTTSSGQTTMTGPDGQGGVQVTVPRGSLDATRAYKEQDAVIASDNALEQVLNPATGRMEFMRKSDVLRGSGGGTQSASAGRADTPATGAGYANEGQLRGAASGDIGGSLADYNRNIAQMERERAGIKDAVSLRTFDQGLADLKATRDKYYGNGGGGTQPAGRSANVAQPSAQPPSQDSGRFAAGPSMNEKAGGDALTGLNASWIKNSYDPAINAGQQADTIISSAKVARQAMTEMGGTGWGAENRLKAKAVLEGLGIATQEANRAVVGMQKFQSIAMTRLQATLNAASGPQTEGDSDRAMKTWAQLGNTVQANEFILDLAQANAERDKMKANFFLKSSGDARRSGDMTSLDLAWSERSPSVFAMPTMKRWGVR